jgi:arylsulfatase A-like enzyme
LRAREVIEAVRTCRAAGEDILLMVGSDHGHQTVTGVVDIEHDLISVGLKDSESSRDVVAVSNGTSALIYVHPDYEGRIPALHAHLERVDWVGRVVPAETLGLIGHAPHHSLAFAVSMRASDEPNAYGVRGKSLVAKPASGKADRLGCGQHGGLAAFEQAPFLFVSGKGFVPGSARGEAACVIDIAPTVLTHLGVFHSSMDGRTLQRPDPLPTMEGLACQTSL